MQARILPGRGRGARSRTSDAGAALPSRASFSSAGRSRSKPSMMPVIVAVDVAPRGTASARLTTPRSVKRPGSGSVCPGIWNVKSFTAPLPSMPMVATRGTISSSRRGVDTRRDRRDRTAAASWTELSLVAMIGPPLWKRLRTLLALSFVWVLTLAPLALAAPVLAADERPAGESQSQSADSEAGALSAPVVIDGRTLFRVRGTSSFSAERRAAGIAGRLKGVAPLQTVSPGAGGAVAAELGTAIFGGREGVMVVFDADAQLESLGRKTLAELLVRTMREAVADYRLARTRDALLRSAAYAAVATVLLAALVTLVVWVSRWAERVLEEPHREGGESPGIQ